MHSGTRRSTREARALATAGANGQHVSVERADAERAAVTELEAWRARAIPDAAAPLDADDLARLVRECFLALGIDADAGADFSVNTVHYYRRKDILDAPAGRTSAARYGVRHVWQAAGARLAGALGLVTLAEARTVMRGADEPTLVAFVAARVADARSRQAIRRAAASPAAPPVAASMATMQARPLPGATHPAAMASLNAAPPTKALAAPSASAPPVPAVVFRLPGEAWCIVPETHAARHSPTAARDLVRALAAALRVTEDVP